MSSLATGKTRHFPGRGKNTHPADPSCQTQNPTFFRLKIEPFQPINKYTNVNMNYEITIHEYFP